MIESHDRSIILKALDMAGKFPVALTLLNGSLLFSRTGLEKTRAFFVHLNEQFPSQNGSLSHLHRRVAPFPKKKAALSREKSVFPVANSKKVPV
jgi:hypothetical protein